MERQGRNQKPSTLTLDEVKVIFDYCILSKHHFASPVLVPYKYFPEPADLLHEENVGEEHSYDTREYEGSVREDIDEEEYISYSQEDQDDQGHGSGSEYDSDEFYDEKENKYAEIQNSEEIRVFQNMMSEFEVAHHRDLQLSMATREEQKKQQFERDMVKTVEKLETEEEMKLRLDAMRRRQEKAKAAEIIREQIRYNQAAKEKEQEEIERENEEIVKKTEKLKRMERRGLKQQEKEKIALRQEINIQNQNLRERRNKQLEEEKRMEMEYLQSQLELATREAREAEEKQQNTKKKNKEWADRVQRLKEEKQREDELLREEEKRKAQEFNAELREETDKAKQEEKANAIRLLIMNKLIQETKEKEKEKEKSDTVSIIKEIMKSDEMVLREEEEKRRRNMLDTKSTKEFNVNQIREKDQRRSMSKAEIYEECRSKQTTEEQRKDLMRSYMEEKYQAFAEKYGEDDLKVKTLRIKIDGYKSEI